MDDERYEWVGTREAAARLGVSPSTVERLIRRGELVAERVERPGGSRLLVRFKRPQEPQQAASSDAGATESEAASEPPPAASDAMLALVEMSQRQSRQIEAQAETIAALSERVGRAEATAAALAEQLARERAEVARLRTQAERPWWKWW